MATTYWPDGEGGNTTIKFAPGVYVYGRPTTSAEAQAIWDRTIKPYYGNWIDKSRGHRCGIHNNVVALSYFTDATRPSVETNPANYDWSIITGPLGASCFTAEDALFSISLRFEANTLWHVPAWWPDDWVVLPENTDRWIPNWGNPDVLAFMKNFATAFASQFNSNSYLWTWGVDEQSGLEQIPNAVDNFAEFVDHAATQADDMMLFINVNAHLWGRSEIVAHDNIAYRLPDPKPFNCGDGGNFPDTNCTGIAWWGGLTGWNSAIQNPANGKRKLTIMSSENNGWNIVGTNTGINSPWGTNTTFPLSSEQSPNADMNPAVFVWYHSYTPRATGAKSAAFNHIPPDPGGMIPCPILHMVDTLDGTAGGTRHIGETYADWDRAFSLFGAAGTEAFPTEPYGWQIPAGVTQDPIISAVGDGSVYDTQTGVIVTGSNFEATQGTGTAVLWSSSDGTGTSQAQTVTSWGDTSITLTIAQGSLTDDTNVYLIVTNDTGDASNAFPVVMQAQASQPVITVIATAPFQQGQVVTLTGNNFGATKGQGSVTIYENSNKTGTSVEQSINVWTDTSIIFVFNAGSLTDTVYLTVTNNNLLESPVVAVPIQSLTAPVITDIDDEDFINGELDVPISGSNFGALRFGGSVSLHNAATGDGAQVFQQVKTWSDTLITIDINLGNLAQGTNYIFVRNDIGQRSNAWAVFVRKDPDEPRIDSIDEFPLYEGLEVSIHGDNFGPVPATGAAVFLTQNSSPLGTWVSQTITFWSDTQIDFTVSRGALFLGAIYAVVIAGGGTVSNYFLTSITIESGFPTIFSLSDYNLSPGESFVINGSGFGTTQGQVWINNSPIYNYNNGVSLPISTWTSSTINASNITFVPTFGTGPIYLWVRDASGNESEFVSITLLTATTSLYVDDEHGTDYSETGTWVDAEGGSGEIALTSTTTSFGGGSKTIQHTLGSSDTLLVVRYAADTDAAGAGVPAVTAVTAGGNAMTEVTSTASARLSTGIWEIHGSSLPSPGTINIVVTSAASASQLNILITSYSGAEDVAADDYYDTLVTSGTSLYGSVATSRNNGWILDVISSSASGIGSASAIAGQTEEYTPNPSAGQSTGFSYETKAIAGVESGGWTYGSASRLCYCSAAFIPTSGGGSLNTYNNSARVTSGDNSGDSATYYFYLDHAVNQLKIYGYWPDGDWATDTPITITRPGESPVTFDVDQDNNTGVYHLIATTGATSIGTMTVEIGDDANGYVVADLIKVDLQNAPSRVSNVAIVAEDFFTSRVLLRKLS